MSGRNGLWDIVQGDCDIQKLQQCLNESHNGGLVMDGWTGLHYVCENRSISNDIRAQAIALLIQSGTDVHAIDENGWNALHLLCKNRSIHENGDVSTSIHHLLHAKIQINATTTDSNKTALHLLCENESISLPALEALLKAQPNTNLPDIDGSLALHYLAENPYVTEPLIALLLNHGKTNINHQNNYHAASFHYLCQNSQVNLGMIQKMLQFKADPNIPNNIGHTPFHYMCENDQLSVEILAEFINNSPVNLAVTNSLGKTALACVPAYKEDCFALAQKHVAPTLGGSDGPSISGRGVLVGGEDTSELEAFPALQQALFQWNSSLPPFNMAFYNAICCEEFFAKDYTNLQEVSLQVVSNQATSQQWQQALSKWRQSILLAFGALISPSLWNSLTDQFQRPLPQELVQVQQQILQVWTSHPDTQTPNDRRHRLDKIRQLLSTVFID